MKRSRIAALALVALWPALARAQDIEACMAAAKRAQQQRDANQLLAARKSMRACAGASCPGVIRKDCATWLEELRGVVPSIVPVATDEAGNDLAKARVSLDDGPPRAVDGNAIDVDPHALVLTFHAPDGRTIVKELDVRRGTHEMRVTAVFKAQPDPPPVVEPPVVVAPVPIPTPASTPTDVPPTPPMVVPPVTAAPEGSRPGLPDAAPTRHEERTPSGPNAWKVGGLVAMGLGVLGLGVGAAFGVRAVIRKGDAGCDSNSVCPSSSAADDLRSAQSAGNLSTAFLVSGGLLATGGAVLWLAAPGGSVAAAPSVGAGGAGLQLRGWW